MPSKRRTRVVVEVGGQPRLLFQIRDRGVEGPVLIFRRGETYDDPIAGDINHKETRVSFHPSNLSMEKNDRTLSFTTVTSSEQTNDAKASIRLETRNDCWPFLGLRAPNLTNDKYISKQKPSDEIITLAKFGTSASNSFCYIIMACHADVDDGALRYLNVPYLIIRYEFISLAVLYFLMNVPPLPHSSSMVLATSDPRVNKQEPREVTVERPARKRNIWRLRRHVQEILACLLQHTIERMIKARDEGVFPAADHFIGILTSPAGAYSFNDRSLSGLSKSE